MTGKGDEKVDLVFILDKSDKTTCHNFNLMKSFVKNYLADLDINNDYFFCQRGIKLDILFVQNVTDIICKLAMSNFQ